MVGVCLGAIILGDQAGIVLIACLSFLAFRELISIHPIRQSDRGAVLWAYLAIPVQYLWVYLKWYGMFIVFIPVYMSLLIPIKLVLKQETKGFIRSTATLHWAIMMTVFSISHIGYLFSLPPHSLPQGGTQGLVVYVLFLTQFNDVAQFISGKLFGKYKIIEKVSPNKTWEGFIGGVIVTAAVSAMLGPYLTPFPRLYAVLAGIGISILGFLGDVTMSAVKRDLQIKDSGDFIPGHGGILDRIDSLIFVAPVFFHMIFYLYYPSYSTAY